MRVLLTLAILALALLVIPGAYADRSYADPTGGSCAARDITGIAVSDDAAGVVTVGLTTNRSVRNDLVHRQGGQCRAEACRIGRRELGPLRDEGTEGIRGQVAARLGQGRGGRLDASRSPVRAPDPVTLSVS